MRALSYVLSLLFLFAGFTGFASVKSDIQLIVGLVGFGFAGTFLGIASILGRLNKLAR